MSERGRDEGNTDAPRVDTESGGSAPRRVGDARRDNEASRSSGSSGAAYSSSDRDADRGTSWVSVILGWLAALGAALILSGIVSAVVGAILGTGQVNQQSATSSGISALVGLVITLLLSFIIGGYVAGRMASRSGVKHGILVPLLAILVTIILGLIGFVVGANFIGQLSGITLPGPAQNATQGLQQPQNLGTILTTSGIAALLSMFIGGAIGGAWGARTGSRRP